MSSNSAEPTDKAKFVTEFVLTPFGHPHPYKLSYVAQYRFVHQVSEFLVRRDLNQNIVPGVAESWIISADRKSIIFKLRESGYSAKEVAQSLIRLLRAGQTSHSNLIAQTQAENIEVISPRELKIKTFGDAGAILAPLVMADAAILPDDHWFVDSLGKEQVDWTKSKGPYIYKSGTFPLKANEELVYIPNSNHYLYDPKQLVWRISFKPLEQLDDFSSLETLISSTPSFTTIRYWEYHLLFKNMNDRIPYYETKPNGITFLLPNTKGVTFNSLANRKALFSKAATAILPWITPNRRTNQMAQPGLLGHLPNEIMSEILADASANAKDSKITTPVVWSAPESRHFNSELIEKLAVAIGLPFVFKTGPQIPLDRDWKETNNYDLMLLSLGMSDTDPISGATFIFSPTALGADLPDGSILHMLNAAKDTTDRTQIAKTLKLAFSKLLANALLIPLSYTSNRHYHSSSIELNIKDPFSESVQIWEVRAKE